MEYVIFQTTDEPYQVFYLPAAPDGYAFSAKVELRYLPGAGCWVVSIADAITGKLVWGRDCSAISPDMDTLRKGAAK